MSTTWNVTTETTNATLDGSGHATIAVTVTNAGSAQDRALVAISPDGGTDASWFNVQQPERLVGAGQSVRYEVDVAVPASATATAFGFAVNVSSADGPGSSTVTSSRIALARPATATTPPGTDATEASAPAATTTAAAVAATTPKPSPPWLVPAIAGGVLLILVVIAVVVFAVIGGDDGTDTKVDTKHDGAKSELVLPDLTRRTFADAKALLKDKTGLEISDKGPLHRYDPDPANDGLVVAVYKVDPKEAGAAPLEPAAPLSDKDQLHLVVGVALQAPTPAAPGFRTATLVTDGSAKPNSWTFTWTTVPNAAGYQVIAQPKTENCDLAPIKFGVVDPLIKRDIDQYLDRKYANPMPYTLPGPRPVGPSAVRPTSATLPPTIATIPDRDRLIDPCRDLDQGSPTTATGLKGSPSAFELPSQATRGVWTVAALDDFGASGPVSGAAPFQ